MIGSKGLADSKSAAVANVRPPIELTTAKMNVDKKQSEATKDVDNRLDIKTILTQKFLISYSVSYYEMACVNQTTNSWPQTQKFS